MADMKALLGDILKVAETVVPLIVPGSAGAIVAGKALIDLIDRSQEIIGSSAPLEQKKADLERRIGEINAHADRTMDSLG
jgi:hypothetical protein